MKAISGYAEWFWLMAKGYKDVENRSWSLERYFKASELPARVYLHASKTGAPNNDVMFIGRQLSARQREEFWAVPWGALRGAIIGEVTITGEVTEYSSHPAALSKWFFGPYGFAVKDGVLYKSPIPCKGQLGFFGVSLGGKNERTAAKAG